MKSFFIIYPLLLVALIVALYYAHQRQQAEEIRRATFENAGKRFTFCDHIKHLHKDHDGKVKIPEDCYGKETIVDIYIREQLK